MTKPFKITLVDYEWEELDIEKNAIANREIEGKPIELDVLQTRDKEKIMRETEDSDAILVMYAEVDEDVLENAKNAKIISRYGIGVNMIDVEHATKLNKMVANVNDYCVDEVSDHALAFILAHARRLFDYSRHTKSGGWDFKEAPMPLRAKDAIVGLAGFGKIPARLAEKLTAIGYNVLAYDPYVDKETMAKEGVVKAELDELVEKSDYLSIHVPLFESTKHLISFEEFDRMKDTAYIVNTARGPLINEEALIDALENNKIAGAALDVTETEPLQADHVFREMEQVILTPHAAWYSDKAFIEIREKAIGNILDLYEGKNPTYWINKKALTETVK